MAPYSKRDLLAGVLTAVGTAVNSVANTAHTLVGSTLSTLGTDSAQILQPFLTNNVSRSDYKSRTHTKHNIASPKWLPLGYQVLEQHQLLY